MRGLRTHASVAVGPPPPATHQQVLLPVIPGHDVHVRVVRLDAQRRAVGALPHVPDFDGAVHRAGGKHLW